MYLDIYAGPEYLIHFKYSHILTQIFVSFSYGLFLPLLFPITAFGILNMYIVEKFGLLYFYRKPPMYDDNLQKNALILMRRAPIAMFILAYWALGNPAIFYNEKAKIVKNNQVVNPLHSLVDYRHGFNHTHWYLMIVVYLISKDIIFANIKRCFRKNGIQCCQGNQKQDELLEKEFDEKLATYWESITGDEQMIWYASEIYSNFMFGITSVDKEAIEKLRTTKKKFQEVDGK